MTLRLYHWGSFCVSRDNTSDKGSNLPYDEVPEDSYWVVPDESGSRDGEGNIPLVDVACGMHRTVVIDARGRVWSFGHDKWGCLGRNTTITSVSSGSLDRDSYPSSSSSSEKGKGKVRKASVTAARTSIPGLVEGLEANVRWQRVSFSIICSTLLAKKAEYTIQYNFG